MKRYLMNRIVALMRENDRLRAELAKQIPVINPEIVKYPDFEKPLKK